MPEGSKWRPDKKFIKYWYDKIESRGKDATGYATLCDDGRLFYMKGAGNATKFVSDFEAEDVPVGRLGLLHTRAWTVGPPSANENNHPVIVGKTIVTHNGSLTEIKKAYEKLGVDKPVAEVDSAIIPHAIHQLGVEAGIKFLVEETPGAAAIAALLSDKNLLLAKDCKPLFIGKLPENGFMWSSEIEACLNTTSVDLEKFKFANTGVFPQGKYVVMDHRTLEVLRVGDFVLKTPTGNSQSFLGERTGGNTNSYTVHDRRGGNRIVCAWGRCLASGVKDAMDTDNKVKKLCKEHKKKWQRGVAIPKFSDVAGR